MSDNKTHVSVEHRACIASNQDATRAAITTERRRPVSRRTLEAGTITRVIVDDFWFETVLDDEWVVAYRIVSQPEGLVVGEIRIFPADETWRNRRTRRGEWSGHLQGTRAKAPKGGVTARLLRTVRIDQTIWDGQAVLKELTARYGRITGSGHPQTGRGFVPYALHRVGIGRPVEPPPRAGHAGRKRLANQEYERIAKEYTRLWFRGLRGRELNGGIAKKLRLTESQARNRVSRARKYGFLRHLPARRRRG